MINKEGKLANSCARDMILYFLYPRYDKLDPLTALGPPTEDKSCQGDAEDRRSREPGWCSTGGCSHLVSRRLCISRGGWHLRLTFLFPAGAAAVQFIALSFMVFDSRCHVHEGFEFDRGPTRDRYSQYGQPLCGRGHNLEETKQRRTIAVRITAGVAWGEVGLEGITYFPLFPQIRITETPRSHVCTQ